MEQGRGTTMFVLKGCPKCKGDLAAETSLRRLELEADVVCIQCGYSLRSEETKRLYARLVRHNPQLVPAYAFSR
jgi:hypothetical protein